MTHFCDDWSMSYRRGKEKEKKRNERKKWATEKNQENQLEWGLKWNFWNFLFRMSEGDENNSSPPRPGLVQYLQRDPVTSIMFGLRIYTFFAGCMSILNPYRYWIFEFFGFFFQEISQSNNEIFSNLFSKVLMASAATNALRLHQRIPAFQLNAQTFQNILAEDSGHYLAYSLMFLTGRHKWVYHYKVIRASKRYKMSLWQFYIFVGRICL